MALKKIAKEFLANFKLKSGTERGFLGAYPDVLSRDYSWVIECGTAKPGSVLSFLQDERVKNVGVLPYPYEDEKKLTLHIFSRGENFDQYLTSKTKRVKTVFEKFHRKNS